MEKQADIYFPTNEIEKLFISSIWRLSEDDLHKRKETILPKGTVEIIFNFSDTIYYFNTSNQIADKLPLVFVNGINFKPVELIKTGRQQFLGIQLNSIAIKLLFNISVNELNNMVCNGSDVCSQLTCLAHELFNIKTFNQQVEIILLWISKKNIKNNFQNSINRVQQLINCNNSLTIKKISHELCISDRQLRRFSQEWLGMNTEEFFLYRKYLNCLNLLHHSKQSLTSIGLYAGYYDQSHFIREFKSYTNLTPKQYREAKAEYPGHIFQP